MTTAEERERILRDALQRITRMGRVCPEFETCHHVACADSCGACLLAVNTLHELDCQDPGCTHRDASPAALSPQPATEPAAESPETGRGKLGVALLVLMNIARDAKHVPDDWCPHCYAKGWAEKLASPDPAPRLEPATRPITLPDPPRDPIDVLRNRPTLLKSPAASAAAETQYKPLTPDAIAQLREMCRRPNVDEVISHMVGTFLATIDEAMKWADDDLPLPEDAAIEAAFPTRSGDHEAYAEAMRLVGACRSKGKLVALVTWLIVKAKRGT